MRRMAMSRFKNKQTAASVRLAISAALLAIGAGLIALGIWRGEVYTVLSKATRICLECIGIG